MVQDLKDAETNLVVVDLFKYSMVSSICFHIRSRTNLTLYYVSDKIQGQNSRQYCWKNVENLTIVTLVHYSPTTAPCGKEGIHRGYTRTKTVHNLGLTAGSTIDWTKSKNRQSNTIASGYQNKSLQTSQLEI